MSLIVPSSPIWSYYADNMPSTPSTTATSIGTNVVAGANNVDGTAVSVLSALAFDAEYMEISFAGYGIFGNSAATLLDILIDRAGGTSWSSFIDDLIIGYTNPLGTGANACGYFSFPIWVPAGASIGAQARNASAGTYSGQISVSVKGGNAQPASWWCGTKVESLGITAAASQGTLITPGNSGAFSSWASVGSPISFVGGAVQYGVQGESNATNTRAYRVEFGAGSSRIGPPVYRFTNTAEVGCIWPTGPIFSSIPAGTQMQVRATSNTTNADQIGCGVYVVY